MLISRGNLTVGQTAGRTATEHACVECGESTVILLDVDATVTHRCPGLAAGATWVVYARPATAEQQRARTTRPLLAGLLTVEQAGARGAAGLEVLRRAAGGAVDGAAA